MDTTYGLDGNDMSIEDSFCLQIIDCALPSPIRFNNLLISDLQSTTASLIRCFMVGLVQSFMSSIKLSLPSRAKNTSLLGFGATERYHAGLRGLMRS